MDEHSVHTLPNRTDPWVIAAVVLATALMGLLIGFGVWVWGLTMVVT